MPGDAGSRIPVLRRLSAGSAKKWRQRLGWIWTRGKVVLWRATCAALRAWCRSGTFRRGTWLTPEDADVVASCGALLDSPTAAPEIEGWITTDELPDEDCSPEEAGFVKVGAEVDGALLDEPDDEDDRACGAGSGEGPPLEDGAACGEGSGFGVASAAPGSASAIAVAATAIAPTDRVVNDAAVARAVRVSKPPRRVRQFGRARTSPSQL